MSTAAHSSTVLLAAGSLLVAGLGYGLWQRQSTPGSTSRELVDIDDDDEHREEEMITADEVVKVFETLYLEMQNVYAQLMKQIQAMASMGQQVPQQQIQALFAKEMGRILAMKQQAVCDQYQMDLDCLEEATWEFLQQDNADVQKVVDHFQKFWEHATGQAVSGWRPGTTVEPPKLLSPTETIEAAQAYFAAHTELYQQAIAKYKAEGKDTTSPAVQRDFQQEIVGIMQKQDPGETALASRGIALRAFEQSVQAHANDPRVGQTLGKLQMQQQQQVQALMMQG